MTLLDAPIQTAAAAEAAQNFSRNLAALKQSQSPLVNRLVMPADGLEWVYARDGSLSALGPDGRWWAGCSLPLLAGRSLLKSLEKSPMYSCLLAPAHAGLLQAAWEQMGVDPVLFALVPDTNTLEMILCCHDFSPAIAGHHLWFLAGEQWAEDFEQLLEEHPGLPIPGRFIRSKLLPDDRASELIQSAQHIFSMVLSRRTAAIESMRSQPKTDSGNLLVIAGSKFQLYDGAATLLQQLEQQTGLHIRRFDADNPVNSSPLAFAMAAQGCTAVIAADVGRTDAPNLVPATTRWITWITRPQIPAAPVDSNDRLILAEPSWKTTALDGGWREDQLSLAPWPKQPQTTSGEGVGIIADTQLIEMPEQIADMSSHGLLWEHIEKELLANPTTLPEDVTTYLQQQAKVFGIPFDSIDRRRFVESLILPAYQQGLARLLIASGIKLQISGNGWNQIEFFQEQCGSQISSIEEFNRAISSVAVLIHPWPLRHAHAMDGLGKPVIHAAGLTAKEFIRRVKSSMLQGGSNISHQNLPDLASEIIRLVAD